MIQLFILWKVYTRGIQIKLCRSAICWMNQNLLVWLYYIVIYSIINPPLVCTWADSCTSALAYLWMHVNFLCLEEFIRLEHNNLWYIQPDEYPDLRFVWHTSSQLHIVLMVTWYFKTLFRLSISIGLHIVNTSTIYSAIKDLNWVLLLFKSVGKFDLYFQPRCCQTFHTVKKVLTFFFFTYAPTKGLVLKLEREQGDFIWCSV